MPTTINSTLIAADKTVAAASGDTVNVGVKGLVGARGDAPDGTAIFSAGSNVTVNIAGRVIGQNAVELGDSASLDGGHRVNIAATGVVVGVDAINLQGSDMRVVNDGTINATLTGVSFVGTGSGTSSLVNRGVIAAQLATVQGLTNGEAVSIRNEGQILALKDDGAAIFFNGSNNGQVRLFNSGLIDGNVLLGSGNDRYDGSTGEVTGVIFGDDGNDRFILGTHAERINGGDGIDTVSVAGRAGLRISLDNDAANGGRAKGDVFAGIENVTGANRGADVIRGSVVDNVLDGQGRGDRLSGLDGADTLVGGAGRDTMAGGAGNDTFLFRSASHGGDRITDFRGVIGNDDRFLFDDAGFGGLDLGALDADRFATRANGNAGLDSGDRFVFRTSDTTLWYDADGKGGTGPVLIADLQAGAVVTAGDIFIF